MTIPTNSVNLLHLIDCSTFAPFDAVTNISVDCIFHAKHRFDQGISRNCDTHNLN